MTDDDERRVKITRTRWVTFHESGAVVFDKFAGWYDAFPLIHPDHPRRADEEASLVTRLKRLYSHDPTRKAQP